MTMTDHSSPFEDSSPPQHTYTHNGLSNLLPLAALSVSLSSPNGSVISAVRVPVWIILTVLSARGRKMFLFMVLVCGNDWNRGLHASRFEAQWIYFLQT